MRSFVWIRSWVVGPRDPARGEPRRQCDCALAGNKVVENRAGLAIHRCGARSPPAPELSTTGRDLVGCVWGWVTLRNRQGVSSWSSLLAVDRVGRRGAARISKGAGSKHRCAPGCQRRADSCRRIDLLTDCLLGSDGFRWTQVDSDGLFR